MARAAEQRRKETVLKYASPSRLRRNLSLARKAKGDMCNGGASGKEDLDSKMAGSEDCGSLSTHMKSAKKIAEKYLVHHLWSTQQALEQGELGNVYWLPGAENPTDGLTRERSDVVPPHADTGIWPVQSGLFAAPERGGLGGGGGGGLCVVRQFLRAPPATQR